MTFLQVFSHILKTIHEKFLERESGLEGSDCMKSGKEVTEAKGEFSATACCSPSCKSHGDPKGLGVKGMCLREGRSQRAPRRAHTIDFLN